MNTDRDTPAANAEKDSTPNGSNHSARTVSPSYAVPAATWPKAAAENHSRTSSWKATRTYCTTLVVSMPR
jgi:hypothetical protein